MPRPPNRSAVEYTASHRKQWLQLAFCSSEALFGFMYQPAEPLLGSCVRLQLRKLAPDLVDETKAQTDVTRLLFAAHTEPQLINGPRSATFRAHGPLPGQGLPDFCAQVERGQSGKQCYSPMRVHRLHRLSFVNLNKVSYILNNSRTAPSCPSARRPFFATSFSRFARYSSTAG